MYRNTGRLLSGLPGRLAVRCELMTPGELAMAVALCCLLGPSLLALTHLVGSEPFAAAALVATLLPAGWLVLWMTRVFHAAAHPHAPPAWLRAVRDVAGDHAVDEVLARLRRHWAGHPRHLLTRDEVKAGLWALGAAGRARRGVPAT